MTKIERLIDEYLDYLEIEKNRSPKTKEVYGRCLRKFVKIAEISTPEEISESNVRQFRVWLAEKTGLKKVTQNYYVISIRNFLKFLNKRNYKVLSPDKIELPHIAKRQIEIIENDDLERLLDAPKAQDIKTIRDKAILELLFSTGLRVSELCSLNRYLNLDKGEITVRGKGEKLRVVFISPEARDAVKAYLKKRGDVDEAMFVSYTNKEPPEVIGRITSRAIQRLIVKYSKVAGISDRVTPHTLRHLFATDLLVNGADIRSVQEMLGHASVQTTQIYTHLTNKQLKDIYDNFHDKKKKR